MAEYTDPSHDILYLETEKQFISSQITSGDGVKLGKIPSSTTIHEAIKGAILIPEILLKLDAVQPSSNLIKGVQIAKDLILTLRNACGLSTIDAAEMSVLFVKREEFESNYRRLNLSSQGEAFGFAGDILDDVVVMLREEIPEYWLASLCFHELVHKWLEIKVRVYAVERLKDGMRRMFTEGRRLGLSIKKINTQGSDNDTFDNYGELLNEIGNYALQFAFLSEVKNSPILQEAFSDEIQMLSARRQETMGNSQYMTGNIDGMTIIFRRELVHFDKQGNNLFFSNDLFAILCMELAADLNSLVGQIDEKPFWQVLMESKLEPIKQNILREKIDRVLGSGFYSKLKRSNTECADVALLLKQVQDKLFTKRDEDS